MGVHTARAKYGGSLTYLSKIDFFFFYLKVFRSFTIYIVRVYTFSEKPCSSSHTQLVPVCSAYNSFV